MYRNFNDYFTCTGCENYTCPANTWKCKYSHKCIDEEGICNEYEGEILLSGDCCPWDDFSCEDRSDEDEEMCKNYTCPSGFRKLAVINVSKNILYVMELLTVKMDQMKRTVRHTLVLKVMLNVEI